MRLDSSPFLLIDQLKNTLTLRSNWEKHVHKRLQKPDTESVRSDNTWASTMSLIDSCSTLHPMYQPATAASPLFAKGRGENKSRCLAWTSGNHKGPVLRWANRRSLAHSGRSYGSLVVSSHRWIGSGSDKPDPSPMWLLLLGHRLGYY